MIILCDDSDSVRVESEIEFNSEEPFLLRYYSDYVYLYSSEYRLHSDYIMKIRDDNIKPEGVMIEYKRTDGLISGGDKIENEK